MAEPSEWEQIGLVLGCLEYSVGFLKFCGYVPPFDDARVEFEKRSQKLKKDIEGTNGL